MKKVDDIIAEIEGRKNRGKGLAHFQEYMASIDNPQHSLASIHVAGTNGKGSTVNYLRSMLQAEGYRVGTFTSPYLETHRDRIRINDEDIPERAFLDIAKRYYDSWMAYDLSMFEIDMAIACVYFKEQHCDICIFEVGLGGRLDSTNIITPIMSIITNIGMDHMEQLGDTYAKIAYEKAGIIKEGIPLVTAEEKIECLEVFHNSCVGKSAPMFMIEDAKQVRYRKTYTMFHYRNWRDLRVNNGAKYQIKNASCALEALYQLKKNKRIHLKDESVKKGLAQAQWKGRFEIVHETPLIIVDGAHNEEGMAALCETLKDFGPVRILFAALKDKDTKAMMEQLLTISEDITVTSFPFYRAQDADVLADDFPVHIEEDFKEAIKKACEDTITPLIITGSLYFISQVRDFIRKL